MTLEIACYLQKIGVDTRFVSILPDQVLVNNLRFSKFSRAKEELFSDEFPEIMVVRSKGFQKIATRASRNLKNELQPRENIFIIKDDNCANLTLNAVLEPYTRKYGIKILRGDLWNDLDRLDVHKVALPFDLDFEVENLISQMLDGEKITMESSKKYWDGYELIYPLINVPRIWIESWNSSCRLKKTEGYPKEMVEFLSTFIPDVREKMYKAALFLKE
ncbi:MAG TPA: ATPase [Methanobacteriaceae archaeon]|nr:ATPase [Methanobacteriaceae archaeon]